VRYAFADIVVDTDRFELRCGGVPVHVEPQVFDVLVQLLHRHGQVVTKEELLDSVWGDQFVSESALSTRVKQLRQAVGDDGRAQRVVQTVHGRGYRFVAEVVETSPPTDAPVLDQPADLRQEIHFCTAADGTRLAYACVGSGPPLVRAAHWITHLDYDWQSPVWHHWLVGLARGRTLVRYDERGCGLSDWDVDFSFESWIADLEAVIDRTVEGRFALLGISQGAAVSLAYAVKHPERVTHLILYGGYAQGRLMENVTDEGREESKALQSLVRIGWGSDHPVFRKLFASLFLPHGTPEQFDSFEALQRASASAANAEKFVAIFYNIDVLRLATQVMVPTLVLHATDDLVVPVNHARILATTIPNARLVLLEGRNHILSDREPAWARFLQEVDAFLAE